MELGTLVPQPKWYKRKGVVAGLVAVFLGIGIVAMFVQSSPQPSVQFVMKHVDELPNGRAIKAELRKAHARFEAKRRGNITVAPVDLAIHERYTVDCVSWTGGTCRILDCHASRHSSCVHHWFEGYFCLCPDGTCAGADGGCHAGDYEKLAHGVKIKNVNWNTESLYFPKGALENGVGASTEAESKHYDDKFDLYKIPGNVNANGAKQAEFLVTSTEQQEYVAIAIDQGSFVNTVRMLKLNRGWNDIQMAASIICKVSGESIYQLGSYDGFSAVHWWYISSMSLIGNVQEWYYSAPGPKGQWTFDPPIDDSSLHACKNL